MIRKRFSEFVDGADLCETAYLTVQCFFDADNTVRFQPTRLAVKTKSLHWRGYLFVLLISISGRSFDLITPDPECLEYASDMSTNAADPINLIKKKNQFACSQQNIQIPIKFKRVFIHFCIIEWLACRQMRSDSWAMCVSRCGGTATV